MPKYNVTYTITQSRVFDVPDKCYIEEVLNEVNGCKIVTIDLIEEIPNNEQSK